MDSRFIMIKTLLRLRICHVNSYFFDYLNPAEVIHEIELRHVEYSFFSRIIEVQCRRVHTSITLLASCRTFSTHFATNTQGSDHRLTANKRASTPPSSVCMYSMTNNELHLKLSYNKKLTSKNAQAIF